MEAAHASPPLPDLSPCVQSLQSTPPRMTIFALDDVEASGRSASPSTCESTRESSFFTSGAVSFVGDDAFSDDPLDSFCDDEYTVREALECDAERIVALVGSMDMTNATSFVWPVDELRERLRTRCPLVVLAEHACSGLVVGVAGIDVEGMEKGFEVMSIGSRVTNCPANETFFVPQSCSLCRGLLIHPGHQGAGLGSRLHKARLVLLAKIAPLTPSVVLSARGRTYDEVMMTLGPMLLQPRGADDATPQYEKSTIFEFTYQTSKGVVHLAHQREADGWKFVGVDVSDGGPVWMTVVPLKELALRYSAKASPGVRRMSTALSAMRRESAVAPTTRRNTLAPSG
jgi:hypothetical protein